MNIAIAACLLAAILILNGRRNAARRNPGTSQGREN